MAATARGTYLARMDADDVARPERFEAQVDRLRADDRLVLVGGQVRWIDPFGLDLGTSDYPTDHDEIDVELLAGRGGVICHPASMIRRSAFEQAGGYREQFSPSEDLDLWLRLAEVGPVANLAEVVLDYRQHLQSVTHSRRAEQLQIKPKIVGEAHARRGLPPPVESKLDAWEPAAPDMLLHRWGWLALKEHDLAAARSHGLDLLRRRPISPRSWKLAFCALRGR